VKTEDSARAREWFYFGCFIEVLVGVAAWVVALITGVPLLGDLSLESRIAIWSIPATVPLLAAFGWMLRATFRPLAEIRDWLEMAFIPILTRWSWVQVAVISVLAGVCEELFFRSVLQGGLAGLTGPVPALLIASVTFGLFHLVTRAYAVLATLMGVYLGWIWIVSGNLLAPMIVHALYDFAALMWFRRLASKRVAG
jgi:uncharacterized protein